MKRLRIVLLCLLLLTFPATAEVAPELPIVAEPLELHILAARYSVQLDFNELLTWKMMEARTGIKIQWDQVPMENFTERRNVLLATGDLPDAIFKANMNVNDLYTYGRDGVLLPLNPLLEEYAPYYSALLEQYPDLRRSLTLADGNIYGMPYVGELLSPRIGTKPFVNEKWLAAVGLSMPATVDEYHDMLVAFRDNDANGNGNPSDEIPLGGDLNSLYLGFRGAYGLGTRGSAHALVDQLADGTMRFFPIADQYRDLLRFLKKMYDEKLLDPELFTSTAQSFAAQGEQNLFGACFKINHTFVGQQYQNDFTGLPAALTGPYGDQLFTGVNAMIYTAGAFVITTANEHPVETLRWADLFYGPEGMEPLFLGEKGLTYMEKEDGSYAYTDLILANPDGLSFDQAMGKYLAWGGGGNPSIVRENFFQGPATLPKAMEAAANLAPYLPDTLWEAFVWTDEEIDYMQSVGVDLNSYVTEMRAKFVAGDVSLETGWDNYVATVQGFGLDEYMGIYQTAYDRYMSN